MIFDDFIITRTAGGYTVTTPSLPSFIGLAASERELKALIEQARQSEAGMSADSLIEQANLGDSASARRVVDLCRGLLLARARRLTRSGPVHADEGILCDLVDEVERRYLSRIERGNPIVGGSVGLLAYLSKSLSFIWHDRIREVRALLASQAPNEERLLDRIADPSGDPFDRLLEAESEQDSDRLIAFAREIVSQVDEANPNENCAPLFEAWLEANLEEAQGGPRVTQTELGRRLGMSQAQVSRRLRKIFSVIKAGWDERNG